MLNVVFEMASINLKKALMYRGKQRRLKPITFCNAFQKATHWNFEACFKIQMYFDFLLLIGSIDSEGCIAQTVFVWFFYSWMNILVGIFWYLVMVLIIACCICCSYLFVNYWFIVNCDQGKLLNNDCVMVRFTK